MARVAKDYYEDDDYFDKITEGVKTGLGIAQTYHNIQGAKVNREYAQAQLDDFNRGKDARESGYDATAAENKKKLYDTEQSMKTAYATAATHSIYNAMQMEDQGQAMAYLERELPNVTGGGMSVKFQQVQGPNGPSNAAHITTKDGGKADLYFSNMADFTKQFNNVRQQHGLFTFGERDMAKRADIAQNLWNTLGQDEQAKFGSFEAFVKDGRIRDQVDLIATKDNFSGAEARRTLTKWDQEDEAHGWKKEEHGWAGEQHQSQMQTEGLRRDSIRQGMDFADEEMKHKREISWVYEDKLNEAKVRQDEAQYMSLLSQAAEEYFPDLQPTYTSTASSETDSMGVDLGLGGGSQKKQYTAEQIAKKNYIMQQVPKLPDELSLDQKFDLIERKMKEKAVPSPDPGGAEASASEKRPAKETSKPKPSRDANRGESTPSTAVPQPFGGALGVLPRNANQLADDTARAHDSRDSFKRGVQFITEGSMTRDERRRDEEWRKKRKRQ